MTKIEIEIRCPTCDSKRVVKNGKDKKNKQRFMCQNKDCTEQTFLIKYEKVGREPHIKRLILKMTIKGFL